MCSWRVSYTRRRGMVTKSQMHKKKLVKIEVAMCAKVLRQENKQRSVRTKQEGKVIGKKPGVDAIRFAFVSVLFGSGANNEMEISKRD